MPISICPQCGKKIDAAISASGEHVMPESGDVTICVYCGVLLEYTDQLLVSILPSETLEDMDEEDLEQLLRIQQVIELRNQSGRILH